MNGTKIQVNPKNRRPVEGTVQRRKSGANPVQIRRKSGANPVPPFVFAVASVVRSPLVRRDVGVGQVPEELNEDSYSTPTILLYRLHMAIYDVNIDI